ncbi:MAG: hypothetical protein U0V70_07700 [Terriglobia bacterium]
MKVKQQAHLLVRIPEWVTPDQTHCRVNQRERTLSWEGRYAVVGGVHAGDLATLTFPMVERTDKVLIEKAAYTLIRKGNEVVAIDPPVPTSLSTNANPTVVMNQNSGRYLAS